MNRSLPMTIAGLIIALWVTLGVARAGTDDPNARMLRIHLRYRALLGAPLGAATARPDESARHPTDARDPQHRRAATSSRSGRGVFSGPCSRFAEAAGRKFDIDPLLIVAVIRVESGDTPTALSSAGARGCMQLMPTTASGLGVVDAWDPGANVMGGTTLLHRLRARFRGDLIRTLGAYFTGAGRVDDTGPAWNAVTPRVRRYAVAVMRVYCRIAGQALCDGLDVEGHAQ